MSKITNDKKSLLFNVFTILPIILLCVVGLAYKAGSSAAEEPGPCKGRQWEHPSDRLECLYPDPPIGRWHAVYTEEFAKANDLPIENISTDLSPGVDYMEMDVQPYGNGGTACLVNMLIKKPNDVAVYPGELTSHWEKEFHDKRKLAHFIDLDDHKDKLREIATFGFTTRDNPYDPKRSHTIGSSFAFYTEDILEGYDYISANASCYHMLKYLKAFPDGWGFNYAKASVWGRDKYRFSGLDDPQRPKGKDYYDSRININIPHELVSAIMKDMPIGGR